MITKKMEDALNKQINAELYSSYLYLAMAAQAEAKNLKGIANWFRCQAQEEIVHGMKLYGFLHERGGRVTLEGLDKPPTEWASPLAMFEDAYEHETKVTGMINALATLAEEEKDHASRSFLNWFVDEQVEEEASADEIVQQLRLAGDGGPGLFMINRELTLRSFVYPTAAEGE